MTANGERRERGCARGFGPESLSGGSSAWSSDEKRWTCSKISCVVSCLESPICPVAQNVHPIAQPAWELIHAVRRPSWYLMRTDSMTWPSFRAYARFTVPSRAEICSSAMLNVEPSVARS